MDSEQIDVKHLSPSQFAEHIEKIAKRNGGDYIDAIVEFCTRHGLELEVASSMVKLKPTLKRKVEASASDLNFI